MKEFKPVRENSKDPFDELTAEEDVAIYESGLCAHGCLDELDVYTKEAIIRYGRILLRNVKKIVNEQH